MTVFLDEQLAEPKTISTSTSGDGGDSTGAPSPALRAGGVGSAARFTCFFLRACRRNFFFSFIFFTVLTGAAVPALR